MAPRLPYPTLSRSVWLTWVGIAWFWFLGVLLRMSVIRLGRDELGLDGSGTGMLQAAIAIGIGVGSIAAGRLSGEKVEPGLVPLGSLGMGASADRKSTRLNSSH